MRLFVLVSLFSVMSFGSASSTKLSDVTEAIRSMLEGKILHGEDGIIQKFGELTQVGDTFVLPAEITLPNDKVIHCEDVLSEVDGQTQVVESVEGVVEDTYLASITPSNNLKIYPRPEVETPFVARVCRLREGRTKCQKKMKNAKGGLDVIDYVQVSP